MEIHELLCNKWLSDYFKQEDRDFIEKQALHCPFYVPLEGELGSDWGVIVNPESTRFGLPTFEHDFCGCPHKHKVGDQDNPDEWKKLKK